MTECPGVIMLIVKRRWHRESTDWWQWHDECKHVGMRKFTDVASGEVVVLCSSQPARDWKSCFFYFFIFFSFWSSFFWLENYHFLFIPVKFFHYFFIPVFPAFGIFIFLSFASKMVLGPWELPPEAFSRTLFVCFFDCFCALAIFLSYAFKIDLGNCQKELFLESFSFFSRVGNFSFLCL